MIDITNKYHAYNYRRKIILSKMRKCYEAEREYVLAKRELKNLSKQLGDELDMDKFLMGNDIHACITKNDVRQGKQPINKKNLLEKTYEGMKGSE